MDDLTLRYFDAEMRYLREAGEEFARAHPDRAAMLNLDRPGARDPYVERLFEGFAFLMGRLREYNTLIQITAAIPQKKQYNRLIRPPRLNGILL